jgi:replicative DNA helicase Mcm|tara:strand:+ start:4226 stop:6247 length:2022 start_codon:yes stop_codon:yes gene_type:complete
MELNVIEQIKRFQDFIDSNYYNSLLENVRKGDKFLLIDFAELSKYDPDLAAELLDAPEETIKAIEKSIEQFDVDGLTSFRIRFHNLPQTQHIMIRDIRSRHINKFFFVKGIIRQKSDVRPQVTSAKFECPMCGNIMDILQLDGTFKEPTKCGCGRKGKFVMLDKELVDAQGIVLEEATENLEGGEQPKRINILLTEDLVSPLSERRTSPGSKVEIIGVVKEVPIISKSGAKSTRFGLMIDSNYIKPTEDTFHEVKINDEEEKEILDIANDPKGYNKLVNSMAPSIYGYEKIKEALLLQLMGGVRKVRMDKIVSRGDMHILLVGDPGSGKSALLKRITEIAPKGRYVSGKGVSGAGITASVVRDEFLRGWALEAGAMVLSSDGLVCVDELDKMNSEDRAAMHEALENQTVSISKANIQATLIARTTVLAAANPKFGRFDPYGIIADQIDLPPTLINRFDLIFPIKDLPEETRDERMAKHILTLHQSPEVNEPEIPTNLLRKFVSYARQKVFPKLTDGALEEIKEFYLRMRKSGGGEGGIKSIPISARQLEALVRLSEASARARLDDRVTRKDAKKAIELLDYCLMQVGFDKETGKIDIDRIATGIAATQRSHILVLKDIIGELETKLGKTIPLDEVVAEAKNRGLDEDKVEEALERLKRSGDVYEPKRGFIGKL